jgi:hypothetical protein
MPRHKKASIVKLYLADIKLTWRPRSRARRDANESYSAWVCSTISTLARTRLIRFSCSRGRKVF